MHPRHRRRLSRHRCCQHVHGPWRRGHSLRPMRVPPIHDGWPHQRILLARQLSRQQDVWQHDQPGRTACQKSPAQPMRRPASQRIHRAARRPPRPDAPGQPPNASKDRRHERHAQPFRPNPKRQPAGQAAGSQATSTPPGTTAPRKPLTGQPGRRKVTRQVRRIAERVARVSAEQRQRHRQQRGHGRDASVEHPAGQQPDQAHTGHACQHRRQARRQLPALPLRTARQHAVSRQDERRIARMLVFLLHRRARRPPQSLGHANEADAVLGNNRRPRRHDQLQRGRRDHSQNQP